MADREATRCRKIAEKVRILADWLKAHRPDATHIAVYHTDWLFLLKADPDTMRANGFNVTKEKGLSYSGFTLRPVTQTVKKE